MRRSAFYLGPLAGLALSLVLETPDHPRAPAMAGIALWMAIWWISECVPLAVTALLPLLALPLTGIATAREIAPRYMTSIMFLFIGGFLIAQALERTGLHRRIALLILGRWHASPLQILAGFAAATAFLSLWISNTATTMLMVTVGLAVLSRLDRADGRAAAAFAASLLLVIAYAANIGGMGTPVGTVPNLVLLEILEAHAPGLKPSFMEWMMVGIPVVLAGLALVLALFARRVRGIPWASAVAADSLAEEQRALGPMRREERWVAWVLGLTALAWMTRKGITGAGFSIPGWSSLLPHPGVDDGTVAVAGALALFLLPGGDGRPILDKSAFARLPWGILILLGGGFALATGMQQSGLSQWLGGQLQGAASIPLPLMLVLVALLMTFLTEITSNTAITQVMLPILAALALGNGLDLTLLLMSAALCASCAFMLPVATPPNAIVFGSERIPMRAMVRAGILLNLTMPLLIVALLTLLRPLLP
ncbi:MAG TPA: SLC13/DASS family transporter [Gammaproteobacteria bacterium]|nr:SLC13/DASS family transporter [Gammaproteobacteria bacterium]